MTWLSDDQPVVPRHPQRRVLTSTGIPPNSCKLCQSFSWDPCPEVTSFFRLVELAHYLQGQCRCHNLPSFSEHSSGFDTPTPSSTILLLMRPSPARHKAHHPTRWQNAAIAFGGVQNPRNNIPLQIFVSTTSWLSKPHLSTNDIFLT